MNSVLEHTLEGNMLRYPPIIYLHSPHHSQQYFKNTSVQANFPSVSQMTFNFESSAETENNTVISQTENVLNKFLQNFIIKEKPKAKTSISVAEFHSGLKEISTLLNLLQSNKNSLVSHLDSSEKKWESALMQVKILQHLLSKACSFLTFPKNVTTIQRKLKAIKRKRALKKKRKATALEQKIKKEQEREKLHQEIDKWFDNLKEKNERMKREIEMKKEADNILAEVRRKIHEAKKTIEKLKVFEKLRSARQANSVQKGVYLQPEHLKKFEAKVSHLQKTMQLQLSEYAKEKEALDVMMETGQDYHKEEEALRRKRKLMTFQQKMKSLFGDSEEPALDDPLFLFSQYQNSGNKSVENLLQIRHHWDVYQSEEGESIPQQWVIPVAPCNSSWEEFCTN